VDEGARVAQIGGYNRYKGVVFSDDRVTKGVVITLKYGLNERVGCLDHTPKRPCFYNTEALIVAIHPIY
jgi:hypothetical protein